MQKEKSRILYLHGKNGGEILIGYTFRVGYTYHADCIFRSMWHMALFHRLNA